MSVGKLLNVSQEFNSWSSKNCFHFTCRILGVTNVDSDTVALTSSNL